MLPGIKKIEWAPADQLYLFPENAMLDLTCQTVAIVQWQQIEMVGLAGAEETIKMQNNQNVYSVSVELFMCEKPTFYNRNVVFLLTDVHNKRFLLGGKERPFPKIEIVNQIPSSFSNRRGYKVTITYENTCGLTAVLD